MQGFFDRLGLGGDAAPDFLEALKLSSFSSVLSALAVFLICLFLIWLLTKLTDRLLRHAKLDGALTGFVRTALKIVLWALAIVIVADVLGIPTASLVAVISVAGLALSLSVQNTMANLFAGATLLVTKPFGAGDLVEIGAEIGYVKRVGLFYTVINTRDNRVVSIPNSAVTVAAVVNYTREPLRRVELHFSASYNDATEDVRAALLDAVRGDSRILDDPAPFIAVSGFGDSAVEYAVWIWCRSADYWDVYYAMNERVRESFKARGVSMTYPHLNVHVTQ